MQTLSERVISRIPMALLTLLSLCLWPGACGGGGSGEGVCGNGVVEAGETCDGTCVTHCDDDNACTVDTMTGSPDDCDVQCEHDPIAGCDLYCGNGEVDPWETCDGDCATECDDGDVCTLDVLTGSADTCDVACGVVDITWCDSSDGCCPGGCDANSDEDCAPTCGNGVAEEGEACDGADTRGMACPDLLPGSLGVGDACQSDCAFPSVLTTCCADDVWTTETIDASDGLVGTGPSVAMDATDYPCWATFDNINSVLRYVHWNGVRWNAQLVDDAGEVGHYPSLVMDATGYPHISYFDSTNQILKYARWTGSAWAIQVVIGSDDAGAHSSMALDALDRPHLAYHDDGSGLLKYAQFDGSDWIHETVDATADVGYFQHLTLDSAGRPHISYVEATNDQVMYVTLSGGVWASQRVNPSGRASYVSRPVIDSAGRPHLAYRDADDYLPVYARYNGSTWLIAPVDETGGWEPVLALDAFDRPYVAYHISTGTMASIQRLAYLSEVGWIRVDASGTALLGQISMALDSLGHPHLASRQGMSHPSLWYSHLVCP